MHKLIFTNISKAKINKQLLISIILGVSIVLSIAHHWVNFWGLEWKNQLLIILVCFPITIVFYLCLTFFWNDVKRISWNKWCVFLPTIIIIAFLGTLYFFKFPISWHTLEIFPSEKKNHNEISIYEIKTPEGVVRLSEISKVQGWLYFNNSINNFEGKEIPFSYSFPAEVSKPVTLVFNKSPNSGNTNISLDGEIYHLNLNSKLDGKKEIKIYTQYRYEIPGIIVLIPIFIFDMILFSFPFILLWVIQEISQKSIFEIEEKIKTINNPHFKGLLFLFFVSLILNFISFFSTRLFFGDDTFSYIQGVIYFLKYYNLDGVSHIRGPGTTILFLPIFLFFGKNPSGIKIFLHLLAIGCVFLSYKIGWQLSRSRCFAFLSGIIALFTPEIIIYSNYLMSDLPNAFIGLLFCSLLLSALKNASMKNLIFTMLAGSFAAMIRSENIILPLIAFILICVKINIDEKENIISIKTIPQYLSKETRSRLTNLTLITFLSLIPIISWSLYNYYHNGFLGLSNYAGEILYDGWVYFGEASHIEITDQMSPSVQIIKKVYIPPIENSLKIPTGWDIYPYLINNNLSENKAFALLGTAAWDSIINNPEITLKVLSLKLKNGFTPETWIFPTMTNEKDKKPYYADKKLIFYPENFYYPSIVFLQDQINSGITFWYKFVYRYLVWLALFFVPIVIYRKPFFLWFPLILITLSKILIPTLLGMSLWRYVISGIIPLQIISLAGLQSIYIFIKMRIKKTIK